MKGDFTRLTFAPEKHYSSVRMQQGRVQLDADWNEQLDIATHRVETETVDVVGTCGASGDGFKVKVQSSALVISAGRCYVDGILCENDQSCLVIGPAQPNVPVQPDAPAIAAPGPGGYLVYLDVWQRHLTAVDDPAILESALDAQTATRTKTVWQARLLPVSEDLTGEFPCGQTFNEWTTLILPRSARMQARAQPDTSGAGPCVVPAAAGYQRLENQLYRVEIHQGGAAGTATFKWSRDNGSVVSGVDSIDPAAHTITIRDPGRDAYLSFAAGQWVEVTNDTIELNPDASPSTLVRLTTPTEGTLLTYDPTTVMGPAIDATTFKPTTKVRRWDADTGVVTTGLTNWIPLEGGVQVRFADGDTYATGDYWLIPARAVTALSATGTIEWPQDAGGPALRPRAGIRHHFCVLGTVLVAADSSKSVTDCRRVFPPLTAMTSLYYAGGDGQEAMPDYTQPITMLLPGLPESLRAGVTNGDLPVSGATVRFAVVAGGGSLLPPPPPVGPAPGPAPTIDVRTGSDGIASCTWQLANNTAIGVQTVRATLLDNSGAPTSTPIWYGATLSVAAQVAIDPRNCTKLAPAKTVQDAIDTLCKQQYLVLRYLGGDGQEGPVNRTLPCSLSVGVEDETGKPRPNVQVTFDALSAGDLLLVPGTVLVGTSVVTTTDPNGVAQVNWTLGGGAQSVCHRVDAHLQSPPPQGTALPIHFSATLGQVTQTAFPVVKKISWPNDRPFSVPAIEKDGGLVVTISTKMEPQTLNPSTFIVTAEVAEVTVTGFPIRRSVILSGTVKPTDASDTSFVFVPAPPLTQALVKAWLDEQTRLFHDLGGPGVRCRVTLKGNFISDGREGPPLDGNIFGVPKRDAAGAPFLDLDFNAPGDGIKGGDFESWFWLVAG